jgi:hypothetical protein
MSQTDEPRGAKSGEKHAVFARAHKRQNDIAKMMLRRNAR